MKKIYFTITGTGHYHGSDFLEPKMQVRLVKEPDNEFDTEAIKVTVPGLGQIGHVANSPYTVLGESMSAGRIYDKIGDCAWGTVLYILPKGVLCLLNSFENFDEEASSKSECSEKLISAENIVQNIAEIVIKTLKNGLQSAAEANTQNADKDLPQQDGADTDETDTDETDIFEEDAFEEDLKNFSNLLKKLFEE